MPHNQGYQCFQTVQILSRLHLESLHPRTKYYLRAQTVTDVIVSQNESLHLSWKFGHLQSLEFKAKE